ncbi:unnamed protein product [Polarella glacialis]|uniref:Uncharacterized protein n=1 Tax=Polarella glacialis TaxID=89957 RepID=A0A813DXZ0_POLGL|nr:unnamed protein product [Polarella glacialis]
MAQPRSWRRGVALLLSAAVGAALTTQASDELPDAPAFVSCEGPDYPPVWGHFKRQLKLEAEGPTALRNVAALGGHIVALASDRIGMCAVQATAFAAAWMEIYWQLREEAERAEDVRPTADSGDTAIRDSFPGSGSLLAPWLGSSNATNLEGSLQVNGEPFCLCGCVAALWIVGIAKRSAGEEHSDVDSEMLLHLSHVLLGVVAPWRLSQPYRFGDAFAPAFGLWGGWERPTPEEVSAELPFHNSPALCPAWKKMLGFSTCSASQEEEMLTEAAAASQEAPATGDPVLVSTFALQPPSALSLLLRLQPCDPLRDSCWTAFGREKWRGLRRMDSPAAPAESITVTVIGHHAPGCLAFMSGMQEAVSSGPLGVSSGGLSLDIQYAGTFYLCKALQGVPASRGGPGPSSNGRDPCDADGVKDIFRQFVQRDESISEQADSVEFAATQFHIALVALAGHSKTSNLYVCIDQVLFCWLLRRRSPITLPAPILAGLGMAFMENVPLAWRDEMAADVSLWFSNMPPPPYVQDLLFTAHQHIVLQTFWQLGLQVPWFETPSSSSWSGVRHSPPPADATPSLLVLRSAFWRLPPGAVLRSLLAHLLKDTEVTWQQSFLGGSIHSSSYAASWSSWEAVAAHTATLYVPSELYQLRFRDMYSMGVPVLAPGKAWAMRSLRMMWRMWGMLSPDVRHRLPGCGAEDDAKQRSFGAARGWCVDATKRQESDSWPFGAPFLDVDKDPPGKLPYYYSLSDAERYPYVLHFESLAGGDSKWGLTWRTHAAALPDDGGCKCRALLSHGADSSSAAESDRNGGSDGEGRWQIV